MARVTFRKGAKVARIEANLGKPTVALKQIGVLMTAESQRAFKRQRFGRKKWDQRAPVNIFGIIADFHEGRKAPPARRFQRRPALRDTGRLAASIAFKVIGTKAVDIGTPLPYASVHNFGGTTKSKPINSRVRQGLWSWLRSQGAVMKRRLGFLLNRKFIDTQLEMEVPARPFIGITPETRKIVREAVGVHIMEVR